MIDADVISMMRMRWGDSERHLSTQRFTTSLVDGREWNRLNRIAWTSVLFSLFYSLYAYITTSHFTLRKSVDRE